MVWAWAKRQSAMIFASNRAEDQRQRSRKADHSGTATTACEWRAQNNWPRRAWTCFSAIFLASSRSSLLADQKFSRMGRSEWLRWNSRLPHAGSRSKECPSQLSLGPLIPPKQFKPIRFSYWPHGPGGFSFQQRQPSYCMVWIEPHLFRAVLTRPCNRYTSSHDLLTLRCPKGDIRYNLLPRAATADLRLQHSPLSPLPSTLQ